VSLLVWAAAAGCVLIVAAAALVVASVAFSLERALIAHRRAMERLAAHASESDTRASRPSQGTSLH